MNYAVWGGIAGATLGLILLTAVENEETRSEGYSIIANSTIVGFFLGVLFTNIHLNPVA